MPTDALSQLFSPLIEFARSHIEWAGPLVFLLCLLESLAIVSALIPSTLLLLGIGSLAAAGLVSLLELSVWGVVGAGMGYWVSYAAGQRYGTRIESLGFLARRPEWISRGHHFFERWGSIAILASRFIPPGRAIVPLMAGAMGGRAVGFHLGNWLSAALWVPVMLAPASIGVALAEQLEQASPQTRSLLLIALVVGIILLVRSLRR